MFYTVIGGIAILAFLYLYGKALKRRLFAWFYVIYFTKGMMHDMHPVKKEFFSKLQQHKSYFEDLREQNALRLLEIGPGPGTNFEYYPPNTRIICYDPNPYFAGSLREHGKKFPGVVLERIVAAPAESLSETADESVDILVCSFVFCSVQDVAVVLKEIKRVLVPGGKFFFIEHITSPPGTWRQLLKNVVEPFWEFAFINCHLIRNPEPIIRSAGFSKVETENFTMPAKGRFWQLFLNDCLKGIAEK